MWFSFSDSVTVGCAVFLNLQFESLDTKNIMPTVFIFKKMWNSFLKQGLLALNADRYLNTTY